MTIQYLYDSNGYLIGVHDSPHLQPNSTTTPPVYVPGQRPQFVNGAWITGQYAPLTPMQFYLAFTTAERIAIKKSTDPDVVEFWATYNLAVTTNTPINPNLVSVQEGLAWMATPTTATPAGPGILASTTRIVQISNGIPQ
jgi:hypothetical protein